MPFIAKSAAPGGSGEPRPAAALWPFALAATGGLTLLTAPPGFLPAEGLRDALRQQGRQLLWLRLGAEDRDPGTFMLSLVAGGQRLHAGFGRPTLELMRHQPGPVAGWPPLFHRLAADLAEAMAQPAALVLEDAHQLGPASPTLALLGSHLLPGLDGDTACVVTSHLPVPAAVLPDHAIRRSVRDLRLQPAVVDAVLERDAPGLGRESARRAAVLCGGGADILAAVCWGSAVLGTAAVERAIRHASRAEDLLTSLARAWLQPFGPEARRALGLALRLEYSHPTLTRAVMGGGLPPAGPWLQPLTGGWLRVRTVWRDPLRSVLAPDRLLDFKTLHRAADHLVERGAAERAIPLYLELRDPTCAARALAESERLLGCVAEVGQPPLIELIPQRADTEASAQIVEQLGGAPDPVAGLISAPGRTRTSLALAASPDEAPLRLEPTPAHRHGRLERLAAAPAKETGSAAPLLAVHLLGPLRVTVNQTAVEQWPSGRGRSLFKYLLTHRDPWPQRERLMEAFWPRSTPEAARNSLNVALHGLRRALRAAADVPVIVLDGGAYRLHDGLRLWLDVDKFEGHVEAGRRHHAAGEPGAAMTEYELAAALYQGDFLADDPYEEWPVLARERLRLAYLDTLDRLGQLYFAQGRYAACASLCQRIVERDACREDAQRQLMRCYSRQGQPHLALRQYDACAKALQGELGVDPAPATRRLQEAIRRHEPV
jgi:DNA-binding SARP family transcriptional activator